MPAVKDKGGIFESLQIQFTQPLKAATLHRGKTIFVLELEISFSYNSNITNALVQVSPPVIFIQINVMKRKGFNLRN